MDAEISDTHFLKLFSEERSGGSAPKRDPRKDFLFHLRVFFLSVVLSSLLIILFVISACVSVVFRGWGGSVFFVAVA